MSRRVLLSRPSLCSLTHDTNYRMDLIVEFFEKTVSQEHRMLSKFVQQAGGADAALQKSDTLAHLLYREGVIDNTSPGRADLVPGFGSAPRRSAPAGASGSRTSDWAYTYSRSAEASRTSKRTSANNSRYGSKSRPPSATRPQHATPNGSPYYYPSSLRQGSGGYTILPPPPGTWPSSAPEPGYGRDRHEVYGTPMVFQSQPYYGLPPPEPEDDAGEELRRLQEELAEAPAIAIRKNFNSFERKFEILQREITEEMRKIVVHEGDRVIKSVLAGPHERIVDPVCPFIPRSGVAADFGIGSI